VRPVRSDVQAAIAQLNAQNIHHLAYLQSSIYMPLESDPKDAAMALKYAATGRDGKPVMYGDLGYNMDRSTTWWQDRLIEQAKKAISAGFIGIYLDSFGKSSAECFAPDHGHPIGGGNTGIAGQREMAQRMLAAIRKINPDAVLSGEDPVEAFRDLVQVNLFSANMWPGYLPLYRVIWGDYSLGYGRVLAPSKAGPDNIIPEMAALFINGQMMGRKTFRRAFAKTIQIDSDESGRNGFLRLIDQPILPPCRRAIHVITQIAIHHRFAVASGCCIFQSHRCVFRIAFQRHINRRLQIGEMMSILRV
jgi:hypothetical protein